MNSSNSTFTFMYKMAITACTADVMFNMINSYSSDWIHACSFVSAHACMHASPMHKPCMSQLNCYNIQQLKLMQRCMHVFSCKYILIMYMYCACMYAIAMHMYGYNSTYYNNYCMHICDNFTSYSPCMAN